MISAPKGPLFAAVAQVVPNLCKPLIPAAVQKSEKFVIPPKTDIRNSYDMSFLIPRRGIKITSGLMSSGQVRFAHTDIQVPDYSVYRRDSVNKPSSDSQESAYSRRAFTYMFIGGASVAGVYGAKATVVDLVNSLSASADVLALAQVEVKLSDIPEGKNMCFKWRGKPLYVRHRTDAEIETEKGVDVSTLRDPQHDDVRVQKDKWLVLIGVCTHLGCVPIANAGDFGGYYCPCHGSHYDASGRIRKGPAPLNLEVPTYVFTEEDVLLVG